MLRRLAIILCVTATVIAKAQDVPSNSIINQIVEEMAEDGTFTEDSEDEAAELENLAENRLDLNKATLDDLRHILTLTERQAQYIISYRNRYGEFRSESELLTLPGFRNDDVEKLLAFAFVDKSDNKDNRKKYFGINALGRIQRTFPKAKGYKAKNDSTAAAFLGSPNKYYLRILANYGNEWQGGFVAESDAGEPVFSHGISITDFVSGHVAYTPRNKFIKKIIAGHFSARYGQGLGLWNGFSADVSAIQSSIMRNGTGITPNMSASETDYLRGVAASMGTEKIRFDVFASHTDGDASTFIDEDTVLYATSISVTRYHRTKNELQKRNNMQQMLFGAYAMYTKQNLTIGAGSNYWHSSLAMSSKGEAYKKFYPSGKDVTTIHADYKYRHSIFSLYGEIAWQSSDAWAAMQAADFDLQGVQFTIGIRKFGRRYYDIMQNPFSRASHPGGESGLYMALAASPFKNTEILANVNIFSNSWLLYQKPAPTSGYKARFKITHSIDRRNNIALVVRHDDGEDADMDDKTEIARTKRSSFKESWTTQLTPKLRLKTSAEEILYHRGSFRSKGFWISEEAKFEFNSHATVTAKLTHFDTDDYYSRAYTTQPDVLYAMTMPMLFGHGIAATAMTKLTINRHIAIWLWGSFMNYLDRDKISSGNTELNSSHKTEAKVQMRFKL